MCCVFHWYPPDMVDLRTGCNMYEKVTTMQEYLEEWKSEDDIDVNLDAFSGVISKHRL